MKLKRSQLKRLIAEALDVEITNQVLETEVEQSDLSPLFARAIKAAIIENRTKGMSDSEARSQVHADVERVFNDSGIKWRDSDESDVEDEFPRDDSDDGWRSRDNGWSEKFVGKVPGIE